jgi:hypothetical protein
MITHKRLLIMTILVKKMIQLKASWPWLSVNYQVRSKSIDHCLLNNTQVGEVV